LSPGLAGSPGRPAGSSRSYRVFPSPFFHQPGPVPAPDRPGPGLTRQARPGFKTMLITPKTQNIEKNTIVVFPFVPPTTSPSISTSLSYLSRAFPLFLFFLSL